MNKALALNNQLMLLFWELNYKYFGGILPPVDLRFSGRLKSTGGQYFRKPRKLIQISTRYLSADLFGENSWKEIASTLGHEMVHYWLDFRGRPCGHTSEFRAKMYECGFQRYSRLAPTTARYLYQCPACKLPYYRRKRGVWSCGPCSGRRFNRRFQLELVHALRTMS